MQKDCDHGTRASKVCTPVGTVNVSGSRPDIHRDTSRRKGLDSGLECLLTLAHFHHVSASHTQLKHMFGEDVFDTQTLLRAAASLSLKAAILPLKKPNMKALSALPLPAIVRMQDGRYRVLANASLAQGKVLLQAYDQLSQPASTLDSDEFFEQWGGEVILITKRSLLSGISGKFDISWFIPAIIKHKVILYQVLVASFFIQLFALITPLFFQVVIDKVLTHQGLTTLDVLCFGLLLISLFDVVLNGLRNYVFSHTTNRIDVMLGAQLFKHLLHLPLAYFQHRQVGTTVARVHELNTIREFLTSAALTLVIDLGFTIVFFSVLWYYSPKLTWIVLGSLPFYVVLSVYITPILRKRLDEKFQRGAVNQAFLVECVSSAETLKAMAVEPQMQRKWEEQLAAYVRASFKANNLGNVASQCAGFINKVVTVLILWVGATLVIAGSLTVGQLIAFNMIAGRVSAPILKLVQLWQEFQQAGIAIERLGDILNSPTEPAYNPNRSTLPSIRGEVRFDQVCFRYAPDRPEVLTAFSLDVQAGEIIGIVGRSGSGKSTLSKLIQRLYAPESGRILVDGSDLAQVDTAWLRRQVGVVLQESRLFNRTVKENIALVDPSMPIERVIQAAKLAGAHEFILELPQGYDTIISEQGDSLSGGQKQRIAIARALITDPKILIFDEATSALDYESERVVQDNMRKICRGRTVFIIAHRLSTLRSADRIVVVDRGQIVECGAHDALIERDGYYAKLHRYQSYVPKFKEAPKQEAFAGYSASFSDATDTWGDEVSR